MSPRRPVLIMMTRARARQQLEEEILRKEKERAAGARPCSVEESTNGSPISKLSSEVPKRGRSCRCQIGGYFGHFG